MRCCPKIFAALLACLVVVSLSHGVPILPPPVAIPLPSNVKVLTSPRENLEEAVIAGIRSARTEILVEQASFESLRIAEALSVAFGRKVFVGLILAGLNGRGGAGAVLRAGGVPWVSPKTPGTNLHRFCVVDRRLVMVGSYDWTHRENAVDSELLVVDEPGVAAVFVGDWLQSLERTVVPMENLHR